LKYPTTQCIVFEDSLSGVAAVVRQEVRWLVLLQHTQAEELGTKVVIKDFTEITPSRLIQEFNS